MALRIALDAGHCLTTAGKRVDKVLDAAQTREWVLNDRIADHMTQAAKAYAGVTVFRVDDPTGAKDVSLFSRCKAANNGNADVYLSVHHNAGVNLGTGGGIEVFSYKEGTKAARLRDEIYTACIAAGGLKGNRSDPTKTADFYVLKHTKAPAVLVEYGFMDSRTDVPVILKDSYAKAMGEATMAAIAQAWGVEKQTAAPAEVAEKGEVCTVEVKMLKKGTKNEQVKAMQILLIGYGFSCGASGADGDFGAATDKAVRAFQKARGLGVDGICGAKTWKELLGA